MKGRAGEGCIFMWAAKANQGRGQLRMKLLRLVGLIGLGKSGEEPEEQTEACMRGGLMLWLPPAGPPAWPFSHRRCEPAPVHDAARPRHGHVRVGD
jgi:hypothetical protein